MSDNVMLRVKPLYTSTVPLSDRFGTLEWIEHQCAEMRRRKLARLFGLDDHTTSGD